MASTMDLSEKLGNLLDKLHKISEAQTRIEERLDKIEAAQSAGDAQHQHLVCGLDKITKDVHIKIQALSTAMFDPPGRRLAGTTELLESILLYLPGSDLLRAQRTSKRFKDVIRGSPKIQRTLFFLPDSSDGQSRINHLLLNSSFFQKHPPFTSGYGIRFSRNGAMFGGDTHMTSVSAEIVTNNAGAEELIIKSIGKQCQEGVRERYYGTVITRTCDTCRLSVPLKDGSWERMFLSQPAMDVVWLCNNDAKTGSLNKQGAGQPFGQLVGR